MTGLQTFGFLAALAGVLAVVGLILAYNVAFMNDEGED